MDNTREIIKNLINGETAEFHSGLNELISQRAKEYVTDYKQVAFSSVDTEEE